MDSAIYAAIAAIIAPVLTALINNLHQYRMRKLEMVQDKKIQAIQEYAESCSSYIAQNHRAELSEYSKSYGKIFLYADKKHWKDIQAVHDDIKSGNFESASERLAHVCQALSGDMKL